MQILESSDWGLRSARIRLHSADSSKSVTLFPMVHIGDAAFYETAYRDALAHDAVLAEGVKSPVVTRLTRAYRWIPSKRLQIVVQPKYPAHGRDRLIHADLTQEEFAQAWRKVPLYLKLLLYVILPFHAFSQRWTATRASLAKGHSLDDLPGRDEILDWSPETAPFHSAIVDVRDCRLLERLEQVLGKPEFKTIAVVYGAAHMRAVLTELLGRRGFRLGEMEWMTVISL